MKHTTRYRNIIPLSDDERKKYYGLLIKQLGDATLSDLELKLSIIKREQEYQNIRIQVLEELINAAIERENPRDFKSKQFAD